MELNRRQALSGAVTSGIVAACFPVEIALAFDKIRNKAEIPTPALLVDLDRFEANLRTMAEQCRKTNCGLRPHAKTHKCPEIAKRQIAAGAVGICVATVPEAEAMAAAGVDGLLLTSPVVEPAKLARLAKLIKKGAKLQLAVGHLRQAQLLAELAAAEQIAFDLLIDVDVGDRRSGSLPGKPAVELAKQIKRHPQLNIRGVQAYAGLASHVVGYQARKRKSREVMADAVDTRGQLRQAGFNASILSGGSTGTYNIDSSLAGMTELQAGSYVFMDVDYRKIGGLDGGAVYKDFQPALTVLTTVVSATHTDRVSVDAGTKAIDTTTSHKPEPVDRPGLVYGRAGDEFGFVTIESGGKLPKLGERLEFIVPHCDPTVHLHDRYYVVRGDEVVDIWPIVARRES